jgi:hypothetical protein
VDTLNRSAIVVKPKQLFLEWLHAADPTSRELSLSDLVREPLIYLIPECDTEEEVANVLHELCEEIFEEQLAGWYKDTSTWPRNRSYEVFCHWGSVTSTTPCWLTSKTSPYLQLMRVVCGTPFRPLH